jgi:hypothetical protein
MKITLSSSLMTVFIQRLIKLMAYPNANFIGKQALLTVCVIAHSSMTLAFSKPLDMASDCGRRGRDVFPGQPWHY